MRSEMATKAPEIISLQVTIERFHREVHVSSSTTVVESGRATHLPCKDMRIFPQTYFNPEVSVIPLSPFEERKKNLDKTLGYHCPHYLFIFS